MKKSGFKLIIIIVILVAIGVFAYIKLTPEKDNVLLKLFNGEKNSEKESDVSDTKNGVYVYKKDLGQTYNITNSCRVSSLDTYIVVINNDYYIYSSTCMLTYYEGQGNTNELEFNYDKESKKYTLKYNDDKYTKDVYKKKFIISTEEDQVAITKVIDFNNLKFLLENTEHPNHLYNIYDAKIAKASSSFRMDVQYNNYPIELSISAGKVKKYSYSMYELKDLPKLYAINTDYIAIIEKHDKRSILKIIDSDKKTSLLNYNSDNNFPKLVDNAHTLTTDNNIYIDYNEKNKRFDVLISLDGKFCVEDGTDNELTYYRYEITYDYKTSSWTKMNYKSAGYAQSSCKEVKEIMGEDYGNYN